MCAGYTECGIVPEGVPADPGNPQLIECRSNFFFKTAAKSRAFRPP
jgi:hypothetical protein